MSGLFAALGALLAALGLYGLLAYTVTQRTSEIGVRMALGATEGDVMRMVLRSALAMVVLGLVLGTPAALWSRHLATTMIPGLPIHNPWPSLSAVLAMTVVALVAAYLPARRAAHVRPIDALRHE